MHTDVNQTRELIDKWIKEYENGRLTWIIELKSSNEIIGVISASNNKLLLKESEIGFSIGTKYQGNGYAQEAARLIINYLLNDCKLEIIKGGCLKSNTKSANVMIKIGMKEYKQDTNNRYFCIKK